jgi:protein TonB
MSALMIWAEETHGRFVSPLCGLLAIALGYVATEHAHGAVTQRVAQQQPAPQTEQAPQSTPKPPPNSAAIGNWQRALLAHLGRFTRYPENARGAEGVVNVGFSIDRKGNLTSSRIVKSSGSSILDAETLAMIKRAAPLPSPPPEAADTDLSFVVPIRFAVGNNQ